MRATLGLLLLVSAPAWPAETVRIAIGERTEALVRGAQLATGPDSEDGPFTPLGTDLARVRRVHGALEVNGRPVEGTAIRLRAGDPAEAALGTASAPIRAGDTEVRGDVVAMLRGDRLLLVNVLPLEDYVAAVLGGEMPVSFPLEALKAQAVAARTYALQKKIEALAQPFHLGSNVLAQVYGGLDRESPRSREAARSTRGEVVTYALVPIEAYFHASCGGRTETGEVALQRDLPYLQSVSCPCGRLGAIRWSAEISRDALEQAFGASGEARILAKTATGRARRIQLGTRTVDAVTFRQKLGYERVKSLLFDTAPDGRGGVRLTGKGYGHGAGLCQWGAKLLADQGTGYREILARYYAGTELQTLY